MARRREREEFERVMARYANFDDQGLRAKAPGLEDLEVAPHNEQAVELCQGWLDEKAKLNLILVGPIGCGKSYLAGALAGELGRRLVPTLWVNAASMMARIRRGFSDREIARWVNWQMSLAETVPVLILDDLGKVHPGKDVSWVEEQFYALVDARYRNMLPTVVTTEWTRAALPDRVGESVVSRLIDGAWVAKIRKPAEPYRTEAS